MKKIIFSLAFVSLFTVFTAFKARPTGDVIAKVDLTGTETPYAGSCGTGVLIFSSGILQFNIGPDGTNINVRGVFLGSIVN